MTFEVHDRDCSCGRYTCEKGSIQFGTVPGGTRRTRVFKEHEMPKAPEDPYGRAQARHNGVPLVHPDGSPVVNREVEGQRGAIKRRLEAVRAAGTIKE